MTEKVAIANMALSWIGEQEINSIDDDLERARQVKINYESARDATLEAHEWSFAIKRFVPSPVAEAPVFGPAHAFAVPHDILRVLSVHRDTDFSVSHEKEQIQWVLESGYILCDEEVIYCRGIERVEEEGRFSNLFDQALAAKIASLIAANLTSSTETQGMMLQYYSAMIAEAKSRDGLQGRSRRIRNRTLLKAR